MIRELPPCNATLAAPEWQAVTVETAVPAGVTAAVPATAPRPATRFDYTAAGVSFGGQPVVSWAQLALGLLALRSSGRA